ncbi:MAG: acyl-CoA dehydrogenase family protein [Acidimicrobiales bacterium]
MDFTLTDEQVLLRDTARTLSSRECPPSLVRAHMDDRTALDPLWDHLREWTDLADGPLVDLCLFLEETGAVVAPGPFLATTALFRPLGGMGVGTVAWADADGRWPAEAGGGATDSPVAGRRTGGAGEDVARADGRPANGGGGHDDRRTWVLDADVVDAVAVVLFGPSGPSVAFVEPGRLALMPMELLDTTRRAFTVDVPAGLDVVPIEPERLRDVLSRATVAAAAEMVGTTRWMLATTVRYAKDRVQFGRPIGSFQAVKHRLADMSLAAERACAAVYTAAMAHDAGHPDRFAATHAAKAAAGEAATFVAKNAVQLHGGIGFTWDHDLHLYLRRTYVADAFLGSASWHHDRLADLLLA